MSGEKEKFYQEWFRKANEDELGAISILKHQDAPAVLVCLHSHQTAEKYIKGLLVFYGMEFRKTHDLKALATLLESRVSDIFDLEDDMNVLNKFYPISRYPADVDEFSWADAEEAYAAARKIKDFVLKKAEG